MSELGDYLSIGLAIFGYLFIISKAWKWLYQLVFRAYDTAQKKSRIQKAVDELYDALELENVTDGQTVKITTKENLIIMMYRSGH